MRHTHGLGRVGEQKCIPSSIFVLHEFRFRFLGEKKGSNIFLAGTNMYVVVRIPPVARTIVAMHEMENVDQDEQTVAHEVFYSECLQIWILLIRKIM